MESQEVSYDDVVNYVSGSILSGPEDDIWDVIFDWLMTTMATVIKNVAYAIADAILIVGGAIAQVVSLIVTALHPLFTDIQATVNSIGWNVISIISSISRLSVDIISAVGTQATKVIDEVGKTINSIITAIGTEATRIIREVTLSINSIVTNLGVTISRTFDSILASIASFYASVVATTTKGISEVLTSISTFYTQLSVQTQANFDYLTTTLPENIRKSMDTWWDDFLLKLLDFSSWVGKLFDAVSVWVTRDIPGGSPWWEHMLDNLIGFFFGKREASETMLDFIIRAFGTFLSWPFRVPYFWDVISKIIVSAWGVVVQALRPVAAIAVDIFTGFIDEVTKRATPMQLSETTPKRIQDMLTSITTSVFAGLTAMTIAGELTVLGSKIGLGNISAMIYDLTNYKLLTGAFVTALAAVTVRIPMTYYYNDVFRPNLPKFREASDFYARDLITLPEFSKLMSYEGYADVYHDKFADVAYRPVSLYALSSLATTGVFDEKLFADNLRDLGLKPELRELVLTMYKAKATETVKGMMSGVAMTRFKEGFTTEGQFTSELKLLRYSEEEIPMFTAAAELSYATDYLTDMKAAYTDAVRKGAISLDEYRESLGGLGIVPERVESFVLRQRIYLRPKEKATPIGPPGEIYLTDQGKMITDTIRRRRLKETLTRDEEIAELLGLGMPVDYSEAIADNDDIRLAEKKELEPKEIPPKYETDAGKVEIDTIRRERRKLLITREQEVKRLLTLEMPDWFAEAIAGNDDVRLTEKSTEA